MVENNAQVFIRERQKKMDTLKELLVEKKDKVLKLEQEIEKTMCEVEALTRAIGLISKLE